MLYNDEATRVEVVLTMQIAGGKILLQENTYKERFLPKQIRAVLIPDQVQEIIILFDGKIRLKLWRTILGFCWDKNS